MERFGIVSDRIVLLEAMTVAQNLAIAFDLAIDPVPPDVHDAGRDAGGEVGIERLSSRRGLPTAFRSLRSRVYLARALALDPAIIVLEHPTAQLVAGRGEGVRGHREGRLPRRRGLTTVGLLMDERFAKATGGRLLVWQPATGEVRERSSLRFW